MDTPARTPRAISAINLTKRMVVMEDQTMLPITDMFDAEGEPTDDEEEVVSFVFGAVDEWYACSCLGNEDQPTN